MQYNGYYNTTRVGDRWYVVTKETAYDDPDLTMSISGQSYWDPAESKFVEYFSFTPEDGPPESFNIEVIGSDSWSATLRIIGIIDGSPVYRFGASLSRSLTFYGGTTHAVFIDSLVAPAPCYRLSGIVAKFKRYVATDCPNCGGFSNAVNVEVTWTNVVDGSRTGEAIVGELDTTWVFPHWPSVYFSPLGKEKLVVAERIQELVKDHPLLSTLLNSNFDLQLDSTDPECLCMWYPLWGARDTGFSTDIPVVSN
jgi:hypothetical protein